MYTYIHTYIYIYIYICIYIYIHVSFLHTKRVAHSKRDPCRMTIYLLIGGYMSYLSHIYGGSCCEITHI